MGVAEFIGGAALAGVGVLIGLALIDDRSTDTLATEPALTVDVDATTTTVEPTTTLATVTTVPATTDAVTTEAVTTEPATTEPPVETTAATTTTEPVATTTTEPAAARVRVMVLNGGRPPGAAQTMSEQLAAMGYDVAAPGDSVVTAGWTIVFTRPEAREAALSINEIVGTDPALVIEPAPDDPNWAVYGQNVDVLVLLGTD
ncbi:MAG: LytR C-terminal domain-containing protein [Desertimonas sp.]